MQSLYSSKSFPKYTPPDDSSVPKVVRYLWEEGVLWGDGWIAGGYTKPQVYVIWGNLEVKVQDTNRHKDTFS